MNARSHIFEISVEPRQMEEAVLSLFHTVLFHRTMAKFTYSSEEQYHVGTLGYEEVDCDFVDHTYIRAQSPSLDENLRREVQAFSSDLKMTGRGQGQGQVCLEFYQKKRKWPLGMDAIPWEVWTVRTELRSFPTEHERLKWSEKLGEMLSEKVVYVTEVMNRHDYVPKMPSELNLDLIFDTSYEDCQPFLFKVSYATSGPNNASVGTTVRRLLKDTLAI